MAANPEPRAAAADDDSTEKFVLVRLLCVFVSTNRNLLMIRIKILRKLINLIESLAERDLKRVANRFFFFSKKSVSYCGI